MSSSAATAAVTMPAIAAPSVADVGVPAGAAAPPLLGSAATSCTITNIHQSQTSIKPPPRRCHLIRLTSMTLLGSACTG